MQLGSRRLAILLMVSVGINLFVLGLGAARLWHRHEAETHRMGPGQFVGHHGGPQLRKALRAHRPELRQHRKALRDARRKVGAALEREPFDPGALDRAFGELRTHTAASQRAFHAALAEAAKDMPRDMRSTLAKRARHGLDHPNPP